MFTLEDLLRFVELHQLQSLPFSEVICKYEKEMDEIWKDMQADQYLMTENI